MEVTKVTYNREIPTWLEEMHMVYPAIVHLDMGPLVVPDMAPLEHLAMETVRLVTPSIHGVEVTRAAMSKTALVCP